MTEQVRRLLALLGALGAGALMLWGMSGLPPVGDYRGPYGDVLAAVAPPERHALNVVTAINFDYRGFDTLGEEFMLFAAVAGTTLLLRRLRSESEFNAEPPARQRRDANDALHAWGIVMVGCTLVFGAYIIGHGQLSPGGGFQGGCILASAWLVVFLAGDLRLVRRVTTDNGVQIADATGAGAYAVIGLSALLAGGAFLQNLLPLGTLGSLLSAGTIPVINAAVGLEVTAGFVLILLEFLRQTLELHGGEKPRGE